MEVKRKDILKLRDRYAGKQTTGWVTDRETGAIIVYGVDAVFLEGEYYSIHNGKRVQFSKKNYIKDLREQIGHDPIEGSGTGVVVYRTGDDGVEVLLQLRTDVNQYGLLGGGIELGDTYKACAVGELLQEAALVANEEDLQLKEVYAGPKHVTRYESGDIVFHTVVVYSLEYKKCHRLDIELDSETKALEWISIAELKTMLQQDAEKFFPNNVPIMEDIVNKFFK